MRIFTRAFAVGVAASALLVAGLANAADYEWTFQTSETSGEPGFINKQKWADEVGRLSGGRIAIELLPAGAVVPHTETLQAVGAGILQGHMTDPSYFAGQDPAFAMMGNLVGAWSDPFELLGFMDSGGGNELYAELIEPYGLHFVGAGATEPEAFISKVPIRHVEDLKGVKLRAPEGMVFEIFAKAGAAPVALPASEIFTALDKGVVDAADNTVFATNQAQGLHEFAHYPMYPGFHSLPLIDVSMNKDLWDSLPEDIQAIMSDSIDYFRFQHIYSVRQLDAQAVAEVREMPDVEIINWSNEDRQKFRQIAEQEWKDWAGRSEMTQKYYDAVTTYLTNRGLL